MRERGLSESAVFSPQFNALLWRGAVVHASEDAQALARLETPMRAEAPLLIDILKEKYARLSDEQRFFNEEKVCLATDVLSPDSPAGIFKGTYFHGHLTNELATQRVCSRDERPNPLYYGCDRPVYRRTAEGYELGPIAGSGMSNHIGASVILITGDLRIQYWRQSRGEQNVNKDAATGSGSCDWNDWASLPPERRTLTEMAKRAMERELREESGLLSRAVRTERIDVRLLAYFRWVRRGGKPEFVGLARTAIPANALRPDVTEVDAPRDTAYYLDASSMPTLKRQLDDALRNPVRCALPLWVALTSLRRLCDDDPAGLSDFIW
jgi:hypothetical protein